jgi:hypothetical protein
MGLRDWLTGSSPGDTRIDEEVAVDVMQHDAYRRANNQTGRKLPGSDPASTLVNDMVNEAVVDAEKHVPRWLW